MFLLKARPLVGDMSATQVQDYIADLQGVHREELWEECTTRLQERYGKIKVHANTNFNKLKHQEREKLCFVIMMRSKEKFCTYLKNVIISKGRCFRTAIASEEVSKSNLQYRRVQLYRKTTKKR